ncbi:MAG: nicotinate-nucleotide adenylyltransferase [Planctomycetota bacterium]
MKRRIILFGGSFDPIHKGHIIVAQSALASTGAGEVVFIPALRSPHKSLPTTAEGSDRSTMVSLAIAGYDKFSQSDYELARAEPSYTYETVTYFRGQYSPGTEIHWLAGADSVAELGKWHRIADLIDICNLSIMYRAGFAKPDFSQLEGVLGRIRIEKLRRHIIRTPLIDISSTEIRRRLSEGDEPVVMLDPAVLQYIRQHNLYVSNRSQTR